MKHLGIPVECRHVPPLDPDFMPLLRFNRAFLAGAKRPVSVTVERVDGQMAVCITFLHGTPDMAAADRCYLNRLVKTILWMKGGFRVYVGGSEDASKAMGGHLSGCRIGFDAGGSDRKVSAVIGCGVKYFSQDASLVSQGFF